VSIFLSYRREDSAGHAGRLYEHLGSAFGSERIFMDVDDISPGQDFAEAIESTVATCQALVAIIGPRWLIDLRQRADREDFVHHEVAVALRRNVTVIPVLVGGGTLPSPADLPENLAALSRRQALEIRDTRFDDDAKLLVAALRKIPGITPTRVPALGKTWTWLLVTAALLLIVAGLFWWDNRPSFDINGTWIAEMKKPNQPSFRVRLDLAGGTQGLIGSVRYPTGEGAIQTGRFEGGRLTFYTVHVPQFASEPATIRWTGVVDGDSIRLTAADDNGVASGMAHRGP
jgi:hypothetical protein